MENSHDKIAGRLALILSKFNNGESFTVDELAEESNVTKRTIQRDLGERLSFLPIVKEKGRYSLESYALGKLSFEDLKTFAAISGIKKLYPALTDGFISDILNTRINKAYLVKTNGFENLKSRTKEFEELSAAALTNKQVSFSYKEKKRLINPYKLVNTDGIWYLVGDEEGDLKNYAFSKISNLQILDTLFTPNKDFLEMIRKNELTWFSQNAFEVKLEIDAIVAEYFLRRKLFANQTLMKQQDGSLLITTKVSYDDEILNIVKYWLPHVKILSPSDLREKLEKILKEYLKTT